MNISKLKRRMKTSLYNLGQKQGDRTYGEFVNHCFQGFFQRVDARAFPAYLRQDYKRMKTRMSEEFGSGKGLDREEARGFVDEFIELLCDVQTYRSPEDPGERFFNADELVVPTEDPTGTDAWRASR